MSKIITKCECGVVITSTSKSQMEYNIKLHRESKKHKRIMKTGKFFECQRCGKSPDKPYEFIYIHHKDKNNKNDDPSNLAYVCKDCHSFIHSNKNKNKEFLTNTSTGGGSSKED